MAIFMSRISFEMYWEICTNGSTQFFKLGLSKFPYNTFSMGFHLVLAPAGWVRANPVKPEIKAAITKYFKEIKSLSKMVWERGKD